MIGFAMVREQAKATQRRAHAIVETSLAERHAVYIVEMVNNLIRGPLATTSR